jgi:hypothetical protein
MQQRFMKTISIAATVMAGTFAVACGDTQQNSHLPSDPLAGISPSGATDSSNTPPTSNGPVASVSVSPHEMMLPKGWSREVLATALDANGGQVAKKASWRSGDVNIVTVGDSGVVFGKALGTTKVYGTVDGFTDSATVTVIDAPPQSNPPPATPGVAQFDYTVIVSGSLGAGMDTTKSELVAGVTVTLTRIGGVNGDTLATPVAAGSAVTDANGVASFRSLAGGSYAIDLVPPASSPYAATRTGIGPPHVTDVRSGFILLRK